MMLGYLLARSGVEIIVLEKHADFLRDFRGDTIHPSTLELMYELGILEEFLKRPHQEVLELAGQVGTETVKIADFTPLPTHCKFLAFMPQWDFLNFIAGQGRRYPRFNVRMQAEVTDLIEDSGRIVGVKATTPRGVTEIHAALIVGADGRHSIVRERAGLSGMDIGAPMDVLWMRISRRSSDPGQTFGHAEAGKVFVMIERDDYWQCGFVIPKGGADEIRKRGIEQFREEIANLQPFLRGRVGELRDWNDVSLLTVKVDRSGSGPALAFCALAMRPTQCLPSEASESTWQFRMRWRRRTLWPQGSPPAPSLTGTFRRSSGAGNFRLEPHKGCRWSCKTESSGGFCPARSRSLFPCR